MPLGTRDILLIIRAKDQASRILADVGRQFSKLDEDSQAAGRHMMKTGAALVGAGVGIAAVGAQISAFFADATKAAMEYNQQAALTLTQVDQVGATLNDMKEIGKNVAAEIPAAFGEMQDALYDIFSSMNVTVAEGELLLREFSKAAVAGQVDVRTASRATIAFLNAYRLPAEKVNMVNDVMFQLVRKGVGTYQEFAESIGRVIPAAVRTGQEITTMAGAMAFLTRNGLSTEMAATSAARGMELMANPKFVERIEAMGLSVKNAAGEYKQINDFVTELGMKLSGLPGPERVAILTELMKGAGNNIQARRFWDMALKNFDQLNGLVADMENSAGALDTAYGIMFEQPQSQMQLFKNNLDIVKTEIGDIFLPTLNKLLQTGIKVLQWWRDLDPEMKTFIVRAAAIIGLVLTVVGVLTALVGIIVVFAGAAALLGISLGGLLLIMGGVILVIAALAYGAYYLYKNWDKWGPRFKQWWENIKKWAEIAWQWMQKIWDKITVVMVDAWHTMQDVWDKVSTFFVDTWHKLQQVWDTVTTAVVNAWHGLVAAWQTSVATIKAAAAWFWDTFGPGIMRIFTALKENVPVIISEIVKTLQVWGDRMMWLWNEVIYPVISFIIDWVQRMYSAIKQTLDDLWTAWQIIWDAIGPYVKIVLEGMWNTIKNAFDAIVKFVSEWGKQLWDFIKSAWDGISQVIAGAIQWIRGVIQTWLSILRGDWGGAWEGIKNVLSGAWEFMKGVVTLGVAAVKLTLQTIVDFLKNVFEFGWNQAKTVVESVWEGLKTAVSTGVDFIVSKTKGVWNWITDGLQSLINTAIGYLEGFLNSVISVVNRIIDAYNRIPVAPNVSNIPDVNLPTVGNHGGGGGNTPRVGAFAAGAVIMPRPGGTLGVFAEAGIPEAAIPLDDSPDNPLVKALSRALQMNGGGAGNITVLLDGEQIAFKIVDRAVGGAARVRSR